MKHFYLFCFLLLGSAWPTLAQVPGFAWQRTYGTAARDERGGVAVAVPTGGFLIAGQQFVLNSTARSQVYLVRTNSQGDTLWTRRFVPALSLQPNPTGLAIDIQGNVLLTVSSVGTSSPAYSHLIKFNPTCDTIRWQNLYQPTMQFGAIGASNLSSPYIAPDGNYLFMRIDITGSNQTFYFQSNLIKVNAATGAQIWNFDFTQYSLSQGFADRVTASNPTPYAGGVMVMVNLSNATFTVNADENLFISFAGTVAYRKRNPNPTYVLDNSPVFHTLRDGNILVGRRQKLYKISADPPTAGDTLWRTVVPPLFANREWDARDMVEDVDGNILLVADSHFAGGTSGSGNQIHLVRFTGRGALVQDSILRRTGDWFARSAMLGPTGRDLIYSGYARPGAIGGEDLFLTRYTGYRPLATVPGGSGPAPRLALYPNPAGGSVPVQVELPDRRGGVLRVFDALGRTVGQQAVAAGGRAVPVPVAGLSPGLYVLRYEPAGGGLPSTARLLRE